MQQYKLNIIIMKTEFTKGKWGIFNAGDTIDVNANYIDGFQLVAEIPLSLKKKHQHQLAEKMANAKLIAAAPELLENLIRCVDRLEENGFGSMSAVERAKKAIKKATK